MKGRRGRTNTSYHNVIESNLHVSLSLSHPSAVCSSDTDAACFKWSRLLQVASAV
jgi:hypothetical protein